MFLFSLRVLVACEFSGTVRDAFREAGHDAWSCDIYPSVIPGPHIQKDVLEVIHRDWDLMIAHPPCTHLANSGAKHFKRMDKKLWALEALDLFRALLEAPVPRICVENPVGKANTILRKPDQIIHPWQFGDEAEKTTCLWLKGLKPLQPTEIVGRGEFCVCRSGKRLPKWYSDNPRKRLRSITFKGIARAMAAQWG